ncbi:MAG TPA: hypothetical protein VFI42_17655, partial [Thermomicrobiaceae bacterium]|nr:hypothetical protein [Thermomicrobiaceae bacterium]
QWRVRKKNGAFSTKLQPVSTIFVCSRGGFSPARTSRRAIEFIVQFASIPAIAECEPTTERS